MTGRSRKRRSRPLSDEEQLERALKEARGVEQARENGAERLFAAMGVERPRVRRRAADDFLHLVEHEPERVARAMARRALELVDDARVPAGVRAMLCLTASQDLAKSVPSERELAADLLGRALALDPGLRPLAVMRRDRPNPRAPAHALERRPTRAQVISPPNRHPRSGTKGSDLEVLRERLDELLPTPMKTSVTRPKKVP